MDFKFYYNNVPGKGLCRNNLIYTSLVNEDMTVFRQWYHNDTDYHKGQNQVVDPSLMNEKWSREICFLYQMEQTYPQLVPRILDIDLIEKKVDLEIQGVDFWQQTLDNNCTYDDILPDWREQMLDIFKAHKDLGIYKYSLHPSSYFVIDGKLKSMNYFFTYSNNDKQISVKDVLSHISEDRQADLIPRLEAAGMQLDIPQSFRDLQLLAFDSFKNNFNEDVMEKAKQIYV
jgi:hypothetical protein